MKDIPSTSFWPIAIFAGLTAVGALTWLSDAVSLGSSAVEAISAPYPLVSNESAAAVHASEHSARDNKASPVTTETAEPGALQTSTPAEIARRQADLRSDLNVAAGIGDTHKRNETLARLCYQWAELDPRNAVKLANGFHLDDASVLENLTLQWASVDLPAARAWIDAHPAGETRARLVARIGFLWAQTEPETAANYVIDETIPGEIQTEAAISVLHQWTQQDPQGAVAWARKFPAGELRERALRETLRTVSNTP